jgi:hypothetical protein
MSRDLGDFAVRGVNVREGGKVVPILTPLLSLMRCRHCRSKGVNVTALAEDGHLLGWCMIEHAQADGLRLPARPPSPAARRRGAR